MSCPISTHRIGCGCYKVKYPEPIPTETQLEFARLNRDITRLIEERNQLREENAKLRRNLKSTDQLALMLIGAALVPPSVEGLRTQAPCTCPICTMRKANTQ